MIRSAFVPVTGHGTRLLPVTKSQPKEIMLPVARKPIVQYVAEEFVTGRSMSSIGHFDSVSELTRVRKNAGFLRPQERRYDIGNFPSYIETFVEFALAGPLYGKDFRAYLERLLCGGSSPSSSS